MHIEHFTHPNLRTLVRDGVAKKPTAHHFLKNSKGE